MRFALLALVIVGCAPKKVAPSFAFLPAVAEPGMAISNESAEFGEGGILIFGDLTNSEIGYKKIIIMYDVLDDKGRKIDETAASCNNVQRGQVCRFRTFAKRVDAKQFRAVRILTEGYFD